MSHVIQNIPSLMNKYAYALYSGDIQTPIFIEPEMLPLFKKIAADKYVAPNSRISDLFQACQCPPVTKGNTEFEAEELETECGEIYVKIDRCDLEKHMGAWGYRFNEPNKNPLNWQFAQYMYGDLLLPKRQDESDHIAWSGEKVAPTAGTPSANYLNTFTGLKKRLTDGRASSSKPIPTVTLGTLAADGSDRYDKMKDFIKGMSAPMRQLSGTILMSEDEANMYMDAKLATYPYQQNILGTNNEMKIDRYPNKRIKGLTRWNGSKIWLFIPDLYKDNLVMLHGLDAPIDPQGYWSVDDDMNLRYYAKYYRGFGYQHAAAMVMNDQI
jgi:hypothetical protein